jgi:hypothetical protein
MLTHNVYQLRQSYTDPLTTRSEVNPAEISRSAMLVIMLDLYMSAAPTACLASEIYPRPGQHQQRDTISDSCTLQSSIANNIGPEFCH